MNKAMPEVQESDQALLPEQDIASILSTAPHKFLQPTISLHSSSISAAESFLNPLAHHIGQLQSQRRAESRRKRKRSFQNATEEEVLHIKQVYTDGFEVAQIWAQAKRILDAAQAEVVRGLEEVQQVKEHSALGTVYKDLGKAKAVHFDDDDITGVLETRATLSEGSRSSGVDGSEDESEEDSNAGTDELGLEDSEMQDEQTEDSEGNVESPDVAPESFVEDPNGLNDGFFSIDDFNRQSQFLEQQDALGEPDGGAASDEEDVDWDTDPLTFGAELIQRSGSRKGDQYQDSEESEVDGPTFGDADLYAESDDESRALDQEELATTPAFSDTSRIRYQDFFDPPPRKSSKTKRMRALPKTQPPKTASGAEFDDEVERAVSDVRRDLFDEETSDVDELEEAEGQITGTMSHFSTHEKQRMKLMAEIRRLEAAAVAKRDWALSGEASAIDRPLNSLMEEDLDFERTGKPVPVITNEVSEDIEALIKRRILAREFDEVVRRRPEISGGADSAATIRRGQVQVDDAKSKESLSSIYELDYLRLRDPKATNDGASSQLKKEHAEIYALWKDISSKLDLLSNWNYRPKVPEASVTVVADAPTISMEDARPSMAAGLSGTSGDAQSNSLLAPHEIYAPGSKDHVRGKAQASGTGNAEVLLQSGHSLAKEEMTRENKSRRRKREKARQKKRLENERAVDRPINTVDQARSGTGRTALPTAGVARKKSKDLKQKNIIDDLKKGNVKVIGRSGELTDVQGQRAALGAQRGRNGVRSDSALKL